MLDVIIFVPLNNLLASRYLINDDDRHRWHGHDSEDRSGYSQTKEEWIDYHSKAEIVTEIVT